MATPGHSDSQCLLRGFLTTPEAAIALPLQLLFGGSITPGKRFVELMQLWRELARHAVPLELAIVGSVGFNMPDIDVLILP